jgi:hypothetical protein
VVALYRIREKVTCHYLYCRVHGRSSPKIRALYKRAMQVRNMDGIELIQKGLLRFELIQNDFNNYYSAYDKICFSMVISPKVEKVLHQMELVSIFYNISRLNQANAH